MNAIILSIGDELASGQTVDTNSAWLSRELGKLGIPVRAHLTVPDNELAIAYAFSRCARKADLVIASGGLGPTADDLTRQGLAKAMGVKLVLDEASLERIAAFFAKRHRQMSPANRVQAMIPQGAQALENALGTAPGIAARLGKAHVYVMPGVPWEMQWIFQNVIASRLEQGKGVIEHRTVYTFGLGESDLGARISDLMIRNANPLVGTTVNAGMVCVRVTTSAENAQQARQMSDKVIAELRARLGELIVGLDDQTMAWALGDLLRSGGQTLATAESCTGGLAGEIITSVPGSSDYYLGGVVAYANRIKCELLGVGEDLLAAHGAVSEPVAAAMAEGCRRRLAADWAISITGIAGPGGGTEQKPVGLVFIGLAGPGGTIVHRHVLPGTRDVVRLRAALTALNHLRLALLRQKEQTS